MGWGFLNKDSERKGNRTNSVDRTFHRSSDRARIRNVKAKIWSKVYPAQHQVASFSEANREPDVHAINRDSIHRMGLEPVKIDLMDSQRVAQSHRVTAGRSLPVGSEYLDIPKLAGDLS